MRVLHVVRQFSPSVGGLEDAVLSIAAAQRSTGLDARVVTLDRVFGQDGRLAARDAVEGVPVRRLPWRGSTRYPLAPTVLAHLGAADLLHVHAIDFFFDYLAATRPLHRRPMVASTHGGFFHSAALPTLKKVWFGTITRASVAAYDRIVACSRHDAALFAGHAGRRLVTIENGINQAKFSDAAAGAPTRTIISFGRFAAHKRVDALFPLLARLRAQDGDWRLIVAGRNADQTADGLRRLAAEAGVAEATRFVLDPSDAALRAAIGEASYFGCLSAHEGFGIAAVEAMSAGLVPVLSGIPPFRHLVAQGGIGLIVDPDRPDAAAASLLAGAAPDRIARESMRARAMVAARPYDWNDVAGRYAALYAEVVPRARAATPAGG